MINAVICAFKSGDVLQYSLPQLVNEPGITRILLADGPHLGNIKPGYKADTPTVKEVVDSIGSDKIFYEYTDDCETRSMKVNRILKNAKECEWFLNVDSDEVYHEDDLKRLIKYLKDGAEFERYKIRTINPYPDFHHEFRIPDWKPRLYKNYPGCGCESNNDRMHQYILHPKQKQHSKDRRGMAMLPEEIARIYHLNALRGAEGKMKRVLENPDGTITWRGGNEKHTSKIHKLDIAKAPKTIRESGKATLR